MNIKLSKKHGLNPSLAVCPVCGKEVSVVLFGHIKGDLEAPKNCLGDLCDDCKDKYIRIIEVESETNRKGTGRYTFVPKEAINIDCPKGVVIMASEDFTKMFVNDKI